MSTATDLENEPRLTLAARCMINDVAALKDQLLTVLGGADGDVVQIDCSAVEGIDAASFQVLVAARTYAAERDLDLKFVNPSQDFLSSADYVGARELLINS